MNRLKISGLVLISATLSLTEIAHACSTCKCGDPTLTLLGVEKPYADRLRMALDYQTREEIQGQSGVDRRRTEEDRLVLGLAYSPNTRLTLAAQIPFVSKRLQSDNLARQEAEGLGDIDLQLRYVAWQDRAVFPQHLAGLSAGVRLPTTEEVETANGRLVDIDAQPDAGATAPNLGAWYGYYRFPWFATASARYFAFGDGKQDFQPGNAAVASLRLQYGMSLGLAAQFGMDLRHAQRNRFDGVEDPNSGGFLAMAYVGAAWRLQPDLLLDIGAQIPAIDGLNGEQEEKAALRTAITYDF